MGPFSVTAPLTRWRAHLPAAVAGSRQERRRQAVVHGLVLSGLLFGGYLFLVVTPSVRTFGFDAMSWWAIDLAHLYSGATPEGPGLGSFRYAPVIGQLLDPLGALPFWQFLWLYSTVLLGTALWLGGRRRWLAALAFPPVALELYHGNIHLLMAAAITLGFRYPAAWAFVLLTKVTPGVGLVWFAVRREYRSLAIVAGATAIVSAVSLATTPGLWLEWVGSLLATLPRSTTSGALIHVPIFVRLPAAALLVAWGARSDRHWTVPVAATIAMPVLWATSLAVLTAVIPLTDASRRAELRPAGVRARGLGAAVAARSPE
ncbi:MAG TPA: hypothetical protein VFK38_06645 [Candidatus Limnocylindrales bacterium]|nr:hypothetical protein [Candidatus Limnocylindrales bacterium]